MSRCFPYPPPGYVKDGIRNEALIESIKLLREAEKVKKERRKEKKREKKEKEKVKKSGETESKNHSHKKRQKQGDHRKRREKETEHFGKSSLTEEHGHPVGSQNSFDSTLNNSKRQKPSTSLDGKQNAGSIIRIRLPVQGHKDPEELLNKEQPCSSGRIDNASVHGAHEPAPGPGGELFEHPCFTSRYLDSELTFRLSKEKQPSPTSASPEEHTLRLAKVKPCPPSGSSEVCSRKPEKGLTSNLCGSPLLAMQYRNLIDWVPPPLEMELTDIGDEDWLFEMKKNLSHAAKRSEISRSFPSHEGLTPWPSSCFLPEAEIYALPYTLPF